MAVHPAWSLGRWALALSSVQAWPSQQCDWSPADRLENWTLWRAAHAELTLVISLLPDEPLVLAILPVPDEPLLLVRAGCPLWVGRDRVATAQALLAAHPEVDVILSDDGLQHYRLGRDVEIAVLDAARGLGNGWRLPAGPLRESARRLASVNAVVLNGEGRLPAGLPDHVPAFRMRLQPGAFWRVSAPAEWRTAEEFRQLDCVALAGIGHPERFFDTVRQLGIPLRQTLAFPDHHAFVPADVPAAGAVLVTEKDAVKLVACNNVTLWALPVSGGLEPDLADWLVHTLEGLPHGRQAA